MQRSTFRPGRREFLAGGGAAAAFAIVRAPAKAAQFNYKYATNNPAESPMGVRMTQLWKAIEVETGGRLSVRVFPDSALGGETDMLTQLRLGAIELFTLSGTPLSAVVPATSIENVPMAFKNRAQAYAAFDGPLGAYMRSEIEAKGLHAFERPWELGFYQLTNNVRPIQKPDDMVGLKMRAAQGKMSLDAFKAFGASPTPMNVREAYTALKTHLVDGQINPYQLIELNKYFEVQRYLSEINLWWSDYWLLMNPAAWKALPADIQAVVTRNASKYALLQRRDSQLLSASSSEKLVRQGMEKNIADQTAFRAKLVDTGFYSRIKPDFSSQAWTLLEAAAGAKLT